MEGQRAAHGLIGEIDESATGDGTIVCRDGFTATTVSPARFTDLTRGLGSSVSVSVLHGSSVVCSITVQAPGKWREPTAVALSRSTASASSC